MKRYRTIIVLAALLLALGGLATWDEHRTKQEKAEEETKNRLVDFKVENVTRFSFDSKDENAFSVSAEKVDGAWKLTSPVQGPADGGSIDNVLKTISDFNYTKVVAESRDKWKDFGLENPVKTVSLTYGPGKDDIVTVMVGNKAPVGFSVYLRTASSDKVYLGGQHLLMATTKSLHEFRDKSIAAIDEKTLTALTYERAGQAPIVLKRTDNVWRIEQPEALEADAAEVRDLIDEVNLAKAAAFDDKPSDALLKAFTTPAFALSWTATDGKTGVLKFGLHDGRLFASTGQGAAALPEEFKTKIEKDLTALRNRRIMKIDSVDLSQLDINGDTYKAVDGSWYKASDTAEKPAEVSHLRAFVVDLEFARTDRFYPLTDPMAVSLTSAPAHRVTLTFKDPAKQAPITLDLYPAPDAEDKYLVKASGASYMYRVNKSVFNGMTPPKPGEPVEAPSDDPEAALDDPGLNLDMMNEEMPLEEPVDPPPVATSDGKANNG